MSLILVTNDDGISSPGIKILAKKLGALGEVYVIAPETEQSAVAHALTLHKPLKFEKTGKRSFHLNGTPTDCVIVGMDRILESRPDLIVSGINRGANLGDDITYSGTVAAAIEGTLLGVPSIAISLARDDHNGMVSARFQKAADYALHLSGKVLERGLPADTLLNVNVPDMKNIKGVKFTKQGKRVYENAVTGITDPRGREFYWIGGGTPQWEPGADTDFEAVRNGYISITPVHLDLTNYDALKYLKQSWKDILS